MSSLGFRIILIKKIILPVRTFVRSIYNRLVCVALQPAVPINEVHHVLCRGDGANVDGEALQGENNGMRLLQCAKRNERKRFKLLKKAVTREVPCEPVWPPRCPGERELCHHFEASIESS